MKSKLTCDEVFAIHREFWNNKRFIENRECTLASRARLFEQGRRGLSDLPLANGGRVTDGMLLEPTMLSPVKIHSTCPPATGPDPQVCGQLFRVIWPYHKILWLPGILGCKLRAALLSETLWPVKVFDAEWYRRESLDIEINQGWFDKLLEFTQYLVDHFHQHFLVVQDIIARGPGDLLANMMGSDNMVVGMYTHPKEIKRLLDNLAEIFIKVASAQFKIIPEFAGGYCNQYGIWSPGTSIRFQEDLAINLSPELIKEFLVPAGQKVLKCFDYSVVHTHTGCTRLSEIYSDVNVADAIEVAMDPNGPSLKQLLPILARIQKKKPLVLIGNFTNEDLGLIAPELSDGGCLVDGELPQCVPI